MSKSKLVQVNIHVPRGLYNRFRVRCLRRGTTAREVMEGLIELYLSGEVDNAEEADEIGESEKG
jgi:hypothetical protein